MRETAGEDPGQMKMRVVSGTILVVGPMDATDEQDRAALDLLPVALENAEDSLNDGLPDGYEAHLYAEGLGPHALGFEA